MTQEEYSEMLSQAKDQFKRGTSLFGKDGAFHRVLEDFLNAALEGEMDNHLEASKPLNKDNRRNGKMFKEVQTEYGAVNVETPRDREGSFSPEIVKKRQTILAEGLSDKIISLYATGQSMQDISNFLEENYGARLSKETISNITDKVWPEIKSWRSRSLDAIYPIVWMDAIHYKVRDDSGATASRAIYNIIGISKDGYKDLLGMNVAHSEGANFGLNVLTDLQNRGVQDIFMPVSTALQVSQTPFRACFHRQISSFALCTRYATQLSMLAASIRRSFSRSSNLSMQLRPRKVQR